MKDETVHPPAASGAKPARRKRRRRRRRPDERPGETWRALDGWGAPYDVSDLGRVRKPAVAVERRRGGTQHYAAQLLLPYLRNGTPVVQLAVRPGRHRAVRVARLVASLFLPPPPPGAVPAFLNGDRRDVRAANLAWSPATRSCIAEESHAESAESKPHAEFAEAAEN